MSRTDPVLLATAIEAVVEAGAIQLAQFGKIERIDKKGAIDLVTEVDVQVERRFRELIAQRFPDHIVLGEELDTAGASIESATHCWIFDPVDGTTNYAHGLPIFCSSLSLAIDGVLTVAAVYDPCRRELFTAERGEGAFLNGRPIHVSSTSTMIDALLVTGFPYDVHETLDEIVGLFGVMVGQARAVRRLGSAALDLCYVAAGRLDAFWEQRLKPWDITAGALLVQEAGGLVTGLDGSPFTVRTSDIIASNRHLHDQMSAAIAAFRAGNPRRL